ncbi:hypothetical protein C8Q80DRAFT_1121547 [Daedaleopsis nitida]|nr:hypothetical protein C8Q80DRAFT_1121547 [Daedaleopsis nitida]
MPAILVNPSSFPKGRNVVLGDYYGNVLAGFHQYGTVNWTTFFKWLSLLFDTLDEWIVVRGDRFESEQRQHTPTSKHERDRILPRVADRDGKCMVYGQLLAWNTLHPAHIFSRAHIAEWTTDGYPTMVTDSASSQVLGGDSKIGSVQNMLLLSANLHIPWTNYAFGVDPDDSYRITPFVSGLDGIVGRTLELDHILDPSTRPLDQLLRDHFTQGLLKHVKGPGEKQWDYDSTFGIGAFDLSDSTVWGTEEGKERLELELENRLFEYRLRQEDAECNTLPSS